MKMSLSRGQNVGFEFRCWVCRQPKHLRPQPQVPESIKQVLAEGRVPDVCADCGAPFDFKSSKRAFNRYKQYVLGH